jgi:hypothetical protein
MTKKQARNVVLHDQPHISGDSSVAGKPEAKGK